MNSNFFRALLAGLLLLSGLILGVTHVGELSRFLQLLSNLDIFWISAALLFQLGTYCSLALVWHLALNVHGVSFPLRMLVPLAVAKLFADQALPSGGISGMAFIVNAFRQRNIPGNVGMGVMLVSIFSFYGAYVIVAAAAIIVLWTLHDIRQWVIIVSALFFLFALAVPGGILLLKQWGRKDPPRWLASIPLLSGILEFYAEAPENTLRNPTLVAWAICLEGAIFLLDTATLWAMLQALGVHAPFFLAFPCFVMASIVAMLSLIPLGLGTFEATCTGMLIMLGVRLETAFAATLLLRGFTLWLPMLPGLWLTRDAFRERVQ
ncbi:MAG: lysylphosphatidylglycerol synthase transmembrane domain-containing protein [Chlorobiaceae bacterium]